VTAGADAGRHETHSTWNASAAHRWAPATGCPASAILATIAPRKPDSEASREGTQAHELLERRTKGEALTAEDLAAYPEKARKGVEKAFEFYASMGVTDAVWDQYPERKWTWPVVSWLPQNHLAYGFSDNVLVNRYARTIHVVDYKHGRFPVEAKGSRQMMFYAHGVLAELGDGGPWRVFGHIVQPYRWDGEGPVSSYEFSPDELGFFADECRRAIDSAGAFYLTGDFGTLPYQPSKENCHWCPGETVCPMKRKLMQRCQREVKATTPAELAELLSLAAVLKVYASQVEEEAFARARAGTRIPGKKLVNKRGTRKWLADEKEIIEAITAYDVPYDDVMPRELVSPAVADGLVKTQLKAGAREPKTIKAALEGLAFLQDKPGSQNMELVDEDDFRPAVDPRSLAFKDAVKLPAVAPASVQA